MAGGEGFEPPGRLHAHRFSRPEQSTTLPPTRQEGDVTSPAHGRKIERLLQKRDLSARRYAEDCHRIGNRRQCAEPDRPLALCAVAGNHHRYGALQPVEQGEGTRGERHDLGHICGPDDEHPDRANQHIGVLGIDVLVGGVRDQLAGADAVGDRGTELAGDGAAGHDKRQKRRDAPDDIDEAGDVTGPR